MITAGIFSGFAYADGADGYFMIILFFVLFWGIVDIEELVSFLSKILRLFCPSQNKRLNYKYGESYGKHTIFSDNTI